jgi:hypothetical protein
MRRKNEIIAQLLNDEISLEEAMNRAMHIAIEMGDSEFQNWLNKEICGLLLLVVIIYWILLYNLIMFLVIK